MTSNSFQRAGGIYAILAGVAGFGYSIAFLLLRNRPELSLLLTGLLLMLGGLFGSGALVALYVRLREQEAGFALWGLLLAGAGALGSLLHGGYDLSNAIHPPAQNLLALADLPSPVDPRGLMTFGLAGLGLFTLARLMGRDASFPKALSYLGLVLGVVLFVIYLVRLIILDPAHPLIQVVLALTGFVLNPVWYIWLGVALRRGK